MNALAHPLALYTLRMHFQLVDRVLERSATRIVTLKNVSAAEEYLQDHFPSFPVLPGVFMVEAMVQAARELVKDRGIDRLVLGAVRGIKYGRFVRPGESLMVDVTIHKETDGIIEFKGEGRVRDAEGRVIEAATAVSGRFSLRPIRL